MMLWKWFVRWPEHLDASISKIYNVGWHQREKRCLLSTYLVKSLKIPHNILQPHHEAARKVSSIFVAIFPCSRITLISFELTLIWLFYHNEIYLKINLWHNYRDNLVTIPCNSIIYQCAIIFSRYLSIFASRGSFLLSAITSGYFTGAKVWRWFLLK
jgi:hypothetical protein